jgi:hypothetical protein
MTRTNFTRQRANQAIIREGNWDIAFYRYSRSKHGPRHRRVRRDARWWQRVNRRQPVWLQR